MLEARATSGVAPWFTRRESRMTCRDLALGRLTELDDGRGYRAPGTSPDAAGRDEHGEAVMIVDETADQKLSGRCAWMSRQYSGTVGGIAYAKSRSPRPRSHPMLSAADRRLSRHTNRAYAWAVSPTTKQ